MEPVIPQRNDKYTMDRAQRRLRQILEVSGWLLSHTSYFKRWDLYELKDGEYTPFDMLTELSEVLRCDLANAVTVAETWRIMAAGDGVDIECE